ncbi:MAG: hypothetical protein LBR35_00300 [Rickettsiales bacterium]|jgi:hypothetical protein|nr:hypothetical protein [Rickettsiales bacterium]
MKKNVFKLTILLIFIALSLCYVGFLIFSEVSSSTPFDLTQFALKLTPLFILWSIYLLFISYYNIFKQVDTLNRFFNIISLKANTKDTEKFEKTLNSFIAKEEKLLSQKHKDFFASAELLHTKTQNITDSLDKVIQELSTKTNLLSANITDLISDLEKKLANLQQTATILSNSSFEKETDMIVSLAQNTVADINDAGLKLENIIDSTKSEGLILINKMEELIQTNNNANVLFETNCNKLINTSNKVLEESSALDRLIFEENEILLDRSLKAREAAKEFKEILGEQIQNLSQASSHAGTYITLAENSLEKQTTKLTSYINEFYKQVELVKNQIGSATTEMLKFSSDVNSEINMIGTNVSKTVEETYSKSKEVLSHIQGDAQNVTSSIANSIDQSQILLTEMLRVKENLKPFIEYMSQNISKIPTITKQSQESVISLRDDIQLTLNNLSSIFENLNTTIKGTENVVINLQDISESSINELFEGTKALSQENDNLTKTTLTAHKSLQSLTDQSQRTVEELSEQAKGFLEAGVQFEDIVSNQIQKLEKATSSAQIKIKEFKDNETTISSSLFAQKAGVIIENLQTVSVDIARILNPSIKEEIWTKYYDGQKDIFAKYLSKMLTPEKVEKLRIMVAKNETLRDYVVSFVNSFDEVLKSAGKSDQKDILIATYMQTDFAQIYLILKQVF